MKKFLFILTFFILNLVGASANVNYTDNSENYSDSTTVRILDDSLLMYDKINFSNIYKYLNLGMDKYEEFYNIHYDLYNSIKYLADNKEKGARYFNVHSKKDLNECHYILDRVQYRKYLVIINVTLNNKGLMNYILDDLMEN